jgi:hypothetical protein
MNEKGEPKGRPKPMECWPVDAAMPVPFSWLMACAETDESAFWNAISATCQKLRNGTQDKPWARKAVQLLKDAGGNERKYLSAIWQGVQRAEAARIIYLELPEDALTSGSAQEMGVQDQQTGRENMTNVEHLFQPEFAS